MDKIGILILQYNPNKPAIHVNIDFLRAVKALDTTGHVLDLYLYIYERGVAYFDKEHIILSETLESMASDLNVSLRTLQRRIKKLVDSGILYNIRQGNNSFWVLRSSSEIGLDDIQTLVQGDTESRKDDSIVSSVRQDTVVEVTKNNDNSRVTNVATIKEHLLTDTKELDSKSIGDYQSPGDNKSLGVNKAIGVNKSKGDNKSLIRNFENSDLFGKKEKNIYSLPAKVSKLLLLEHNVQEPEDKPINVRAVWRWALSRFRNHNLDCILGKSNFSQMAIKYARNIVPILGKDWEEHRKYIDWYLQIEDKFIKQECKYNFEFLCSTPCVNRWTSRTPGDDKPTYYTDPQQAHIRGGRE